MEPVRIAAVLIGVASCGGGHAAMRDARGGDDGGAGDAAAGHFVYAANQGSNNVVVLAFDAQTGALAATGASISAQMPSFVGLVALPSP